ncbi:TPA: exostosin family protein [Vibrio parahaemolyticus]|nr:exostosin family protein [Vibrio parahaemolyticus]
MAYIGGFQQQEGSFFRYKLWSRTKLRAAISKYQYAGDWKLWVEFAKEEQLYQVDKTLGKFNLSSGRLNNIFSSEYFNEINNDISLAERSGLFSDLENIDDLKRLEIDEQYNILEKSLSGAVTYWLSRRKKEPNFKYIKNTYRRDNLIAYDDEWQFPAITEKHAFNKVKELGMSFNGDVVYFGFPWASLIDLYHNKKPDGDILLEVLSKYKDELSRYKRVVTVCQHIFAIKYKSLLEKVGVTDIFWTHKITGQNVSGNLNIHSFPLYPVQAININVNRETDEYKYLFSFVGAKSNQWYLTQSRTYILEELSDTPGALVKGRDNWHYNTAVYDHQVNQSISNLQPLVDEDKSSEFKDVMDKTLFSLCPSGSGPNSIRLWESLGYGAIPVILADTYEPPGDISLWEQAVVFCKEDRESISKLPSLLSELSQDMVKIENMKHIGKQLWLKYGPDAFIYDVVKFMSKPDCDNEDSPSYHSLNSIDYYVKLNRNLDFCSGLPAKSINTKMLVNSDLLLKEIESSDDSELLLKKIFSKHREERLLFNKLAKAKNFKYTI